ncbi:MAG: hypothetical protein ACKV0T_23310 [Planctomycetales bacterium]
MRRTPPPRRLRKFGSRPAAMRVSRRQRDDRTCASIPSTRRGAFLIVVLVCLLVATVLTAAVLSMARNHKQRIDLHQHRVQADWIAEAALERAAARLRSDGAYVGETWSLSAGDLGAAGLAEAEQATAVITIHPNPEQPHRRVIQVQALYPLGSSQPVRRTRQVTISLIQEF